MDKGKDLVRKIVDKGESLLKKTMNKGKSKVLVDDIPVKKHVRRNNGTVIEENVNLVAMDTDSDIESESDDVDEFNYTLYTDSESDYSDKFVDYLSEGEDELIDLRKRKTEANKAPKKSNRQTFPVNEGTSTSNSRQRVYGVGDSETLMEHEEFMDDLIRKVRDEGDGTTDPFKIVESKVEKYPIHDVETHWRMRKPKIGEKFVDVDQLKECLTYYALANGYSLWFYRSEKTKLIAKCGSRPEMLKEPKKGKQRKWKRYPSTSAGEGSNCAWRCYGKEMTEEKSFQVISMDDEHTCVKDFKYGNLVNYKWIGLKEGWKLGCRNVIALGGCLLKKPNIDLLGDDLDMPTGNGLTLILDQHKAASKASYPGLFNKIIDKIKRANPKAYQCLLDKDPKTWSRAYFCIGINCEAVENGFSECFISVLLRVRNKPLITMLEAMRVIVLERMNTMRKLLESWSEDICPNIQKRLEVTKDQHRFWDVIPIGGNLFEVRNGFQAFRFDEEHRTCTCRLWQLLGLPCAHAIAVIFKLNRRVEDYVPGCFRKQSFYFAYHQYLTPVGGMDFWPDSNEMSRVLPPKPKKMPGRPRKKRIRAAHENKNTNRVSMYGITMTCQNCFQKGHNKKGCKNPIDVLPPKLPTMKGRPRKAQVSDSSLLDEDLVDAPVDSAQVDVIA
ncbi:pentatricopeptide repeat-containing protein [Tanacetum coccineum]|uniref:Pentatricopeptide repeat-containing protein n=1 Tax=Tanacetum coccineum TaxID=301880 RepID=A0ABQ4YJZ3_9ASTR